MTQEYIYCAWGNKAPIETVLRLYALKSDEFNFALNVASVERLRGLLAESKDKVALGKTRRIIVEKRLAYLEKVNAELAKQQEPHHDNPA